MGEGSLVGTAEGAFDVVGDGVGLLLLVGPVVGVLDGLIVGVLDYQWLDWA